MKIIVGLGNPGTKYEQTRHNAGCMAVDFFLKDIQAISCQSKFDAQICELQTSNLPSFSRRGVDEVDGVVKIFFVKPQKFMNLSGEVVKEICSFYKVDTSKDLLVVHDEVDLPLGSLREAYDSGAAGHNGVQNIIDELGTKEFARIRIGVESREPDSPIPTDVFVLNKFTEDELKQLHESILSETSKLIQNFIQK